MATIGKVSAVFTASTSGLRTGVNQATSAMSSLERAARSTASGMRALVAIQGVQLFGNIASTAAGYVRSLIDIGRAQADVIDGQSKLAARLGMTYEEISGLSLAGDLAGVSMDTIAAAVTRADVAFVRASEGSKQARAAFEGIGLSFEDLNGLSAADRFNAIVDAIAALPTEAQRAEAAVQLFGRAGAQLLPLFAGGAQGIQEATEQAERLGLALTDAQGRDVEAMNDSFTMVGKAIDGIVQQVVAYLSPAITNIATQFTDFVGSIGGANIGQAIGDGILEGARYLAQIGDYIIQSLPGVWQYVASVGEQWQAVFEVGQRIFSFFAMVGREIEAAFKFVGSILTGALGRVLNAVGELVQQIPGLGESGRGIEQAGENLMKTSTKLWDEAGTALEAAGENFGELVFGRDKTREAGEDLAGPLESSLDAALARARESAAAISQATAKPIEIKQVAEATVNMEPVKRAVEGIDSRSSEGLKTMFRIMRGDTGNDVQERQLRALEQIADNTEDIGDGAAEAEIVDIAP